MRARPSAPQGVRDTLKRRINSATPAILTSAFGAPVLQHRLWEHESFAALALGTSRFLKGADDRHRHYGHPFPGLFDQPLKGTQAGILIERSRLITIDQTVFSGAIGVALGEDSSVLFRDCSVNFPTEATMLSFTTEVVLAVSFGLRISVNDYHDEIDALLAKALQGYVPNR
jgi:hypothetical protein